MVRERSSGETVVDGEIWAALYSGDTAHGLDVPGMLAMLLSPLAEGGVPVFVASTYNADLILVPRDRLEDAAGVLRATGHRVDL
ncbi:ACT domain-containing protein [Streptomyces sp. NPDC090045]|uniref:ACT domain-containing protein n=1 Tax=Streptomyces sp. NPDC090045 TaxID=3365927 RepID=UPI0037F7D98E